jgi:alpha-1,2-mannosyltransferase
MTERRGGAVDNPRAARSPRFVGWAVAVLAVVALYLLRWSGVNSGNWVDLDVYVRGGQAILAGTPLYEQPAGVLPFTYSPFAGVVFTPLHLFSSIGARWVFTLG